MSKNKLFPILVISILANLALLTYFLSPKIFRRPSPAATTTSSSDQADLFNEINPESGYEIKAQFGNLGPKMISLGVIDPEKFTSAYQKSNQPLTPEQESILFAGSDQKITITRDNSYFLLNFFWAVGLANRSDILDKGQMMQSGGKKDAGKFASTGGWTLAKGEAMNYYSKAALIPLTPEQAELVDSVSANIFRPCCNNSTAFPDCNHGMALLGVLQLMASNGASAQEMYEAAKYFNAFWFPGNYYDLALYFKNKDGLSFKDIDAKTLLSREYSSASGWQNAKQWLAEKGLIQQPPKQGGGCGV